MSTACPDTDALVDVAAALEWDVPARLEHLAACAHCRASLAELAQLRRELERVPEAVPVPASATGRMAGASGVAPVVAGPSHPRESGRASWQAQLPVTVATFLAAAATATLLVYLFAGTPSAPLTLAVAGVAGAASVLPLRVPTLPGRRA
ncbi:MAG TPA: hypothetical protein VF832_00795 [Longimicrobiales bacterium]